VSGAYGVVVAQCGDAGLVGNGYVRCYTAQQLADPAVIEALFDELAAGANGAAAIQAALTALAAQGVGVGLVGACSECTALPLTVSTGGTTTTGNVFCTICSGMGQRRGACERARGGAEAGECGAGEWGLGGAHAVPQVSLLEGGNGTGDVRLHDASLSSAFALLGAVRGDADAINVSALLSGGRWASTSATGASARGGGVRQSARLYHVVVVCPYPGAEAQRACLQAAADAGAFGAGGNTTCSVAGVLEQCPVARGAGSSSGTGGGSNKGLLGLLGLLAVPALALLCSSVLIVACLLLARRRKARKARDADPFASPVLVTSVMQMCDPRQTPRAVVTNASVYHSSYVPAVDAVRYTPAWLPETGGGPWHKHDPSTGSMMPCGTAGPYVPPTV
jgi:hypothetical protein